MGKKDIFGDDIDNTDARDFESFLKEAEKGVRKISVGDKFSGEILSIGKEETFVSTPGSLDAVILSRDLLDKDKNMTVKVGDKVEIVITKVREDGISARIAGSRGGVRELDSLEDAFDMELPVEGRVLEAVKGGFRVQIQSHRAFCPISQMDIAHIKETDPYINRKFEFIITQMDERHLNIVVSRRKLLDLEKADREGELMETLKEGDLLEGKVTRLEKFGAFVEIAPLIEGLIHVSELSWSRVNHPSEVLGLDAPVKVKVIKVKEVDGRLQISLSLKQGGGEQDPWMVFAERHPAGTKIEGTIEKKEVFGFFIKLSSGVTGLLHQSKWREAIDGKNVESKKPGETLLVEIERVDLADHKISLCLPGEGDDQAWRDHVAPPKSNIGVGAFAAAFQKAGKRS